MRVPPLVVSRMAVDPPPSGSCDDWGWVCWLEAHPGSGTWLQGAGTVLLLFSLAFGYYQFRKEGFVPRVRFISDRDGKRAEVEIRNAGRSNGPVNRLYVGSRSGRPWKRKFLILKHDRIDWHKDALNRGLCSFPVTLAGGDDIRLLIVSEAGIFEDCSCRVVVLAGGDRIERRSRRLARGQIVEKNFHSPSEAEQSEAAPPEQSPSQQDDASVDWASTRQDLRELSQLRSEGLLSPLHLWIGQYQTLRRLWTTSLRQAQDK